MTAANGDANPPGFFNLSHCKGERFVLLLMDTVSHFQLECMAPKNGPVPSFCMLSARMVLRDSDQQGVSEGYSAPWLEALLFYSAAVPELEFNVLCSHHWPKNRLPGIHQPSVPEFTPRNLYLQSG